MGVSVHACMCVCVWMCDVCGRVCMCVGMLTVTQTSNVSWCNSFDMMSQCHVSQDNLPKAKSECKVRCVALLKNSKDLCLLSL